MGTTPPINRDGISGRIPHQGSMCLLDEVTAWDDNHISCLTNSHLSADNPLRAHDQLGAACGIEYAAQAMAMHGALAAEQHNPDGGAGNTPTRGGYLASVRSVTLHVDRLDTVAGSLTVEAERITGDANTVLYNFTVSGGGKALLNGRAVVVLDASALATPG